jgi:hypothetical protein
MKLKTDIKDNAELKERVLANAQSNQIWINAFTLINPTDKTYMDIGKTVVEMLQTRENLLPHYYGKEFDGEITDLQNLTPVFYMSVNAS